MADCQVIYRYAFGEDHQLVDVTQLTNKERHHKYTCISCGKGLVPALGKIRKKHFRHEVEADCDGETYLHRLAKEIIVRRFHSDKPFNVKIPTPVLCSQYKACSLPKNEDFCRGYETGIYDLKKNYDQISVEEPIGGFVADLLLKDSRDKHSPFLIEIWVTHECEEEKRQSGYPILEIKVENEFDIERIKKEDTFEEEVYCSALKERESKQPLNKGLQCYSFYLYDNGNCFLDTRSIACSQIKKSLNRNALLECRLVDSSMNYSYSDFFNYAASLGFKVKNCCLCKYYHEDNEICGLYKKFNTPKNPDMRCAYGCDKYRIKHPDSNVLSNHPYLFVIHADREIFNALDLNKNYGQRVRKQYDSLLEDYLLEEEVEMYEERYANSQFDSPIDISKMIESNTAHLQKLRNSTTYESIPCDTEDNIETEKEKIDYVKSDFDHILSIPIDESFTSKAKYPRIDYEDTSFEPVPFDVEPGLATPEEKSSEPIKQDVQPCEIRFAGDLFGNDSVCNEKTSFSDTSEKEIVHYYHIAIDEAGKMHKKELDAYSLKTKREHTSTIEFAIEYDNSNREFKTQFMRVVSYVLHRSLNKQHCFICGHWGGIHCMNHLDDTQKGMDCASFTYDDRKDIHSIGRYNIWTPKMESEGKTVNDIDEGVKLLKEYI